mgnify:CR=1 FL=1
MGVGRPEPFRTTVFIWKIYSLSMSICLRYLSSLTVASSTSFQAFATSFLSRSIAAESSWVSRRAALTRAVLFTIVSFNSLQRLIRRFSDSQEVFHARYNRSYEAEKRFIDFSPTRLSMLALVSRSIFSISARLIVF